MGRNCAESSYVPSGLVGTVMTMILVTGATGTTGSVVLRNLVEKGARARAMTRDPARLPAVPAASATSTASAVSATGSATATGAVSAGSASTGIASTGTVSTAAASTDAASAGFEVVRGDFEDAASLRAAVSGVDAVFLLSSAGGHVASHDLALVDAAIAAGVRKIVKVSAIGTGEAGFETTSGWHLPGENAIRESGMAWTILRPSSFASNTLSWAPQIQAGEPILNHFGTGTNGVVDPRDIAAVAVEALLTDDHDGQIYTLTGPELLSLPDQVAQLAEVLGKPLTTVTGTDDQLRADLLAHGIEGESATHVINGYEFVRQGGNAIITGDVERALGRPPGTYKAWAEHNRAAFGLDQ